ncbi:MAG: hypothetical protein ACJAYK_001291 [Crocinitomicaceae bacterium]|jgi:hypothetical protein
MDTTLIFVALIVIMVMCSFLLKGHLDRKRLTRARKIVDLHDDLRRMQNAMTIIPDLYLDAPTKTFMIKRIIQILSFIQEIGSESESLKKQTLDLESQLDKIVQSKDDSVKRLSQWGKIDDPDVAHEIRSMAKYLHSQILICVKSHLLPRSQGSRIVKNLKVIMHRIALDLNYNIAKNAIKANKLRPALSKLKVAKGLLLKSPIKPHLNAQLETLETLIEKIEKKLITVSKASSKVTANKLASGVDKIDEEEAWDGKKNMYDSEN